MAIRKMYISEFAYETMKGRGLSFAVEMAAENIASQGHCPLLISNAKSKDIDLIKEDNNRNVIFMLREERPFKGSIKFAEVPV